MTKATAIMREKRCQRKKALAGLMLVSLVLSLASLVPAARASEIVNTWQIARPSSTIEFVEERVENAETSDEASVGIGVQITAYRENSGSCPFDGRDGVEFRVAATANTRKGIDYTHTRWGRLVDGFPDPQYMDPTGITGDNSGTWIDIPFGVYFYGGPGLQNESSYYDRVWVCSNGFLSFDSDSTSSSPRTIPDPQEPNALVAVFWTDLDPSGGSIKYSKSGPPESYFIVVWDNVLNKLNGARETFAVLIKDEFGSPTAVRGQTKIQFLYENISGNSNAIIGLEDQEGYKGYTPFPDSASYPTGEDEVWFRGVYNAPEIREITIKLDKIDNQAEIVVSTDFLRGSNMDWEIIEEDPESIYEKAIKGTATLLMSTVAAIGNPFGGLMSGATLLSYDLVKAYAKSTWPANYLIHEDANVSENLAYITASSAHISGYDWPVDASLEDQIYWVFTDQTTADHSVNVYAELKYYSHKYQEIKTISKSVTLNVYIPCYSLTISAGYGGTTNPAPGTYTYTYGSSVAVTATANSGYTFDYWLLDGVECGSDPTITVTMDSDHTLKASFYRRKIIVYLEIYYQGEWWDWVIPQYNPKAYYYVSGSSPYNRYTWSINYEPYGGYWWGYLSGGTYDFCFTTDITYAVVVYDVTIPDDVTIPEEDDYSMGVLNLQLIPYPNDPPGGCPYVSVWNGTRYLLDNNILPASELSNGADVEDYYRLEQNLVPKNGKHSVIISEFEQEHSYIDQVKLLAVDHESDVNIAVTPDGEILTYKNPVAPLSAVDNNGTSRLGEISLIDGNVSDPATYFYGESGDHLILNFGQVNSDNAKLILRDDMKKHDECIEVQVKDSNDNWQTVEVLVPRAYWSVEAVNLSPYIDSGQDLMVRLYWKYRHRLDSVGLDTTKQEDYELHTANLASATHSIQGDIKTLLLESDSLYAELVLGQQIQLEFTLPNNTKQARTYIFYTRGHYYTIP